MSRRKLILHVGLPKTGTSALQQWCHQNRASLLQHGICYPETYRDASDPKHQFLVTSLLEGDTARFQRLLTENESETLFMSTEGLTAHLYDFRPGALQHFKDATIGYEIAIFMVVREREAWTKSYYRQVVLNPPITGFLNATDLKYHEFCRLPRVHRLTDVHSLHEDLEAGLGAREVVVGQYESDWMGVLLGMLGLARSAASELNRVHISVSDDLTELVRQLNAMKLSPQKRAVFLAAVQACFQTKHHTLTHFYPSGGDLRNKENKKILCRLKAETSAQADLIAILSSWLDGAGVDQEGLESGELYRGEPVRQFLFGEKLDRCSRNIKKVIPWVRRHAMRRRRA